MTAPQPGLDVRQVRRNFFRAAARYAAASAIPREIGSRMLERLDCVKIEPQRVLDLGCGAGGSLLALSERYRQARIFGADFSEAMLRAGRGQRSRLRWLIPFVRGHATPLAVADAQALPFPAHAFGLLWSNLMLHWLPDPCLALREMHRVLEPEGLLMCSTLGPDTLKELRDCFADGHAHTSRFVDMHDYGDMLVEHGFSNPVVESERLTLTYANVDALFSDLRGNGAGNAATDRRRGLMGRGEWRAVADAYEKFRRDGRLPATLEVIYAHAWKTEARQTGDGHTIVRFETRRSFRRSR